MEKFSLISAVLVLVDTSSMLSSIQPFPLISITNRRCPDPRPILFPSLPLAFKNLAIVPRKLSSTFSLTIFEVPNINPIEVLLKALEFVVILEDSFKNCILRNQNPIAFSDLIGYFTKIYSVLIGYDLKIILEYQFLKAETSVDGNITLDKLFVVIF